MKKIMLLNGILFALSFVFALFLISIPYAGYILIFAAGCAAIYSVHKHYISKTAELQKSITEMRKRIGAYNYEVQAAAGQIASVSEQLGLNSSENSAYAADLTERAEGMTALNRKVMEDITGVIEAEGQLMEMIEESVNNADAMQTIGDQSREAVMGGLDSILEIVATIDEINKSSDDMVRYMAKLEKTSNEIISILESVEDISQQTHLLALNAAIESARAGNAGRGFAVVADEIGKLSVGTSAAVQNVSSLISGIQEEILNVSKMVNANTLNVSKGVAASKSVESNLVSIRQSFEDVLSKVKGVREVSLIEKNFGNDIEKRANDVTSLMHETEKSVQSVYDAVSKQKSQMKEFSDMSRRLVDSSSALMALFDSSVFSGTNYLTPELEKKIEKSFEIMDSVRSAKEMQGKDPVQHEGLIRKLLSQYDYIEAAWSNDEKGRFLVSIPPAGIVNANVRDWFRESSTGKKYVSGVYVSAITKSPCITVSGPIMDRSGEILGVIGFDIRLT